MVKAVSDAKVSVVPVEFPSTSGTTQIKGKYWIPASMDGEGDAADAAGSDAAGAPTPARKGIVQLVHGMAEYIDRYDDFARFLVGEGFIVVGHDHLAHGESVNSKAEWGKLPARTGKDALVEDTHVLRTLAQERFGSDLPYFIFGHSMGSFVVRAYIARHAEGLAGAIVCGTGHQPAGKSKMGNLLARLITGIKGDAHHSKLMHGMADGAYSGAIKDARTPHDWLNTDPAKVDEYRADEACGYMFTISGYAALTDLTGEIAQPAVIAAVPAGLPVLFIAGSDDPVGDSGEGVRTVVSLFEKAGKNVSSKIYEGMRHEILNEPRHDEVYRDIAAWLDEVIAAR